LDAAAALVQRVTGQPDEELKEGQKSKPDNMPDTNATPGALIDKKPLLSRSDFVLGLGFLCLGNRGTGAETYRRSLS
jgi:hypothetical protein